MTQEKVKTVFITGTSSGIGEASAIYFARNGWKVIATMRNTKQDSLLKQNENIHILELDITNNKLIEECVSEVLQKYDVDVLINNAGYGLYGPFEGASRQQIERVFNTNVFGTMEVTKHFLPHFRERKNGIIINISSLGGLLTFPFNSIYHSTKFAIEGWSQSLNYELRSFGVLVKTICPGNTITDFGTRSLDIALHNSYKTEFDKAIGFMKSEEFQKSFSTPEMIAEVIFDAATDEKQRMQYLAGNDAIAVFQQKTELGNEEFFKSVYKMMLL